MLAQAYRDGGGGSGEGRKNLQPIAINFNTSFTMSDNESICKQVATLLDLLFVLTSRRSPYRSLNHPI